MQDYLSIILYQIDGKYAWFKSHGNSVNQGCSHKFRGAVCSPTMRSKEDRYKHLPHTMSTTSYNVWNTTSNF